MKKFKEEAERRYEHVVIRDPSDVDFNLMVRDRRQSFISGADFGYQQGIEEGIKCFEWANMNGWYRLYKEHNIFTNGDGDLTAAELFQLFKQEQP